MKLKKLLSCFVIVIMGLLLVVSCDTINQIISDTVSPHIEDTVNDLLGLTDAPTEEKFKLPEATRYENFVVENKQNPEKYGLDVIEPKVTFEEYAEDLNKRLGGTFTKEEIHDKYEEVKNVENYTYVDEEGNEYVLNFKELVDENGVVTKWTVSLVVTYKNYNPDTTSDAQN